MIGWTRKKYRAARATMPRINDMIGLIKKNNRAACATTKPQFCDWITRKTNRAARASRIKVHFFDVINQTMTSNCHHTNSPHGPSAIHCKLFHQRQMCIKFLYQYLKTITEISCDVMGLNVAHVGEITSLWLLGNEFTWYIKRCVFDKSACAYEITWRKYELWKSPR